MVFSLVRRGFLYGAFFFAFMWIAQDLREGIGYDRIVPLLTGSLVAAVLSPLVYGFMERVSSKIIRGANRAKRRPASIDIEGGDQ
jgi:hypothetical protein